ARSTTYKIGNKHKTTNNRTGNNSNIGARFFFPFLRWLSIAGIFIKEYLPLVTILQHLVHHCILLNPMYHLVVLIQKMVLSLLFPHLDLVDIENFRRLKFVALLHLS